jgi:hypothetical protein
MPNPSARVPTSAANSNKAPRAMVTTGVAAEDVRVGGGDASFVGE